MKGLTAFSTVAMSAGLANAPSGTIVLPITLFSTAA